MNIFVRLLDKIINRLITAYLARAEEQNLHPHQLLLERAQEEGAYVNVAYVFYLTLFCVWRTMFST